MPSFMGAGIQCRIEDAQVLQAAIRMSHGGFPKLGVTFLGVPIIRTIVFWGLYWGPPFLGNYHMISYRYMSHVIKSRLEVHETIACAGA